MNGMNMNDMNGSRLNGVPRMDGGAGTRQAQTTYDEATSTVTVGAAAMAPEMTSRMPTSQDGTVRTQAASPTEANTVATNPTAAANPEPTEAGTDRRTPQRGLVLIAAVALIMGLTGGAVGGFAMTKIVETDTGSDMTAQAGGAPGAMAGQTPTDQGGSAASNGTGTPSDGSTSDGGTFADSGDSSSSSNGSASGQGNAQGQPPAAPDDNETASGNSGNSTDSDNSDSGSSGNAATSGAAGDAATGGVSNSTVQV